ncbi:MAG: hypothetical protein JNL38_32025 [Myxococcales bacterium]|jgi:hypothetical protein|nr:hypothetical protein [Myxococcales bacterium]
MKLSLAALTASLLVAACEFQAEPVFGRRAPTRPEDDARVHLPAVQAAACLSPPKERGCAAGMRVTFGPPAGAPGREGEIFCEAGRPRARFTRPEAVEGPVSQSVWEAVWRTVDATGGCALAYGGAVGVVRAGAPVPCESPRFETRELFESAWVSAKLGPPPYDPSVDRCAIDPASCDNGKKVCPPFAEDPWAGVTRAPQ